MTKTALMFGSIGSVVESSDIQRNAYNQALQEAGLDWQWSPETYAELLEQAGGKERLSMLSAATGAGLTAEQIEQIHQRKTELACEQLMQTQPSLRPGVRALIDLAKERGMKTAFVTTTYQPNIDAIFTAGDDALSAGDFHYIGSRSDVEHGKPAPDAYRAALQQLGLAPESVLAIEDTANSVMSAKRAGVDVVATPGRLTAGQDFWQADLVVQSLLDERGTLDARVVAMLDR